MLKRLARPVGLALLLVVVSATTFFAFSPTSFAAQCDPTGSISYGGSGELSFGASAPGCSGGSSGSSGGGSGGDLGGASGGETADPHCTWIPVSSGPLPDLDTGVLGQCQYPDGTLGPVEMSLGPLQGPGGVTMTPDQAAWEIMRSIQFEPVTIGMAPHVNPEWGHRRTYVGVPVWMWAAEQTTLNYGTHSITETMGGLTMTLDAQVERVEWDMGDNTTITCGPGQAYVTSYGVTDSPSCGHRYAQTSADQPDGKYTVTATSYWNVAWSGGGQSGTITFDLQTTTQVEVLELQSVNITNANGG